MRWIALAAFVILLILSRKDLKHLGIVFIEGMVGGLIIDTIGVNLGYYTFPRQALYSLNYFAIVVPCWGVFGALIDYFWRTLGKEKFLRASTIVTPFLFASYEGLNLLTGSWVYHLPWGVVAPCWLPLIYTFAGCHRREEVIKKIKSVEIKYTGLRHEVLAGVRVFLTIIMFPLLFVSLFRILTTCKHRYNVSTLELLKAHALMREIRVENS